MATYVRTAWCTCAALALALMGGISSAWSGTSPASTEGIHAERRPTASRQGAAPVTDQQILYSGLFNEPLVPVVPTTAADNVDLAAALESYRTYALARGATDAVEPLLTYLDTHPGSPWRPALQLNIGIIYRKTGHFSQALQVWREGWADSQSLSSPSGQKIANALVARLSQFEAYLGRKETLQPLLASLKDRRIGGTAAQLITDSQTGMYDMVHDPGDSFRCGPLALLRILRTSSVHPAPHAVNVLMAARSTPNGLSLSMVKKFSDEAGMHYQMAFRTPGAPVIVPAVAHWKVGHYAAIVGKENSRYLIQDTTFGEDIRIAPETLDAETSGYFLVPAGALPEGWRAVSQEEGDGIWGRGNTGSNHDPAATGPGAAGPGCRSNGCTTWAAEYEVDGLQLHDHPMGYKPPAGPSIDIDVYYSHRDALQPATFTYTNFGPKWTFSWLSYVTVNSQTSFSLYRKGGGAEPYTFSDPYTSTSYLGPYSRGIITRTVPTPPAMDGGSGGGSGGGNEGGGVVPPPSPCGTESAFGFSAIQVSYPDGSVEQFGLYGACNQFFLTSVTDPAGNTATLTYDSTYRIIKITDAIGEVTTISYGLPSQPLLVTQITDPFGRATTFTYNSSGQLATITDVLGITSSYTYGQGTDPDFINTLTTPYGSSTFVYGDSSTNAALGNTRFLKATDPLGRVSYTEFDQGVDPGDSSGGTLKNPSQLPVGLNTCNQYLYFRNTFVFDPNQYALATANGGLDYSQARVMHWLHTSDGTATSRVLESEKQPLENRVWYNYPEQPTGDCASIYFGVSSDGTVTSGATNQPIAIARVTDSGQTQLQTFTYNSSGSLTQYVDPVGRTYSYTYAANGIDRLTTSNTTSGNQLLETRTYGFQHNPLTIQGANGQTAHFTYNALGEVTRYTDPLGHSIEYSYDGSGRLKSVQAPLNAEWTFAYDSTNRVVSATDPAGYTIRTTYDAADRLLTNTYPDGTTQQRTYNFLDLSSRTDRRGNTTKYQYDADRELTQVTDPLSHSVQLAYNTASQLNAVTDQNNNTTTWVLDGESRPIAKEFADGTAVTYEYSNSENLLAQITDALGQNTTYLYGVDDTISSISYAAPTPAVSYTYDPSYNRRTSMTDGVGTTTYGYYAVGQNGANQLQTIQSPIAGGSGTDLVSYVYDAIGRVVSRSVDGVNEGVTYDPLGRMISVSNALDTFALGYSDATVRVSSISSTNGPKMSLSYFAATSGNEQLQQIMATYGGSTVDQFQYTYDANVNVASFSTLMPTGQTTSYGYDLINRLTSGVVGDDAPQYSYAYDGASNLMTIASEGSTLNNTYTSTNSISSGMYDQNGSPLTLGNAAYTWDGANRVASFTNGTTSSAFTYDGNGRLVRDVESTNGSVTADYAYLWCGTDRCVARDNTQAGSPISSRYFYEGVLAGGTSYYYIRDVVGSVRSLFSSGAVVSRYNYDPYGNRSVTIGTVVSDIGYAGYFQHQASGLNFALFRAYDPVNARWLSRDPISENGGLNLYAYVDSNPVTFNDSSGEEFGLAVVGGVIGGVWGGVNGYLSGDRGYALFNDAASGAVVGGIAGLTNGVSLVEGFAVRAAFSSGVEAIRQIVNGGISGCFNTNWGDIAVAGVGSLLGDSAGFLSATAGTAEAAEVLHYVPVGADMNATVVGGVFGGAVQAPFSAIEGYNRH